MNHHVAFLSSELGKWDTLLEAQVPELLVLPFFSDERPLRGAAGLCDWRLCGRLSRLLERGQLTGERGECTLYPPRRLAFPRLVLFGLGPGDRFDEAGAREASRRIQALVAGLGVQRYAVQPPGRSTGLLSARRALEIYLEELDRREGTKPELWVVESPAGQKEAAELTRR